MLSKAETRDMQAMNGTVLLLQERDQLRKQAAALTAQAAELAEDVAAVENWMRLQCAKLGVEPPTAEGNPDVEPSDDGSLAARLLWVGTFMQADARRLAAQVKALRSVPYDAGPSGEPSAPDLGAYVDLRAECARLAASEAKMRSALRMFVSALTDHLEEHGPSAMVPLARLSDADCAARRALAVLAACAPTGAEGNDPA